jgi:hypothetical protein
LLAIFRLEQPAWLATAFVLVLGVAMCLRHARGSAETRSSAAGAEPNSDHKPAARRGYTLVMGALLIACGVTLVYAGTPTAHALLLALGLGAAIALTVESYRRRPAALTPARALLAGAARLVAWAALLTLIARPSWAWVLVERQKPLLAVLLDHSASMSICDRTDPAGPAETRAEIANQTLARSRAWLERLDELHEVRLHRVGQTTTPVESWKIHPTAPLSALAAALRQAGRLRDANDERPPAVLLISDGGENVAGAEALRQAARELAVEKSALLAVGVGPSAAQTVTVELDPLTVPAQLGPHDRLRVPVAARTQGCRGQSLTLELLWDNEAVASRVVQPDDPGQRVRTEFDTQPPGPGLHRLTARLTLPESLGGSSHETATIVDVREDVLHVLVFEGRPRTESAFVVRAWQGDPRVKVTQRLLLNAEPDGAKPTAADFPDWAEYDVVAFGNVPRERLDHQALELLADAVRGRGVGLLLAGGRAFFNGGDYDRTAVAELSPVSFAGARPASDYEPAFLPTEDGLQHPVLHGITSGEADGAVRDSRKKWALLPPLPRSARLGPPKPLATVLAADRDEQPLLVTHEVGRGRCIAIACESTWPWALSSDAGFELHRRFWRQLVVWLANRRPMAWIVTDQPSYALAAIRAGQQTVRVRAGITGLAALADRPDPDTLKAELTVRRVFATASAPAAAVEPQNATAQASQTAPSDATQVWRIPLNRHGDRWTAELPQEGDLADWLSAAEYELEFVVRAGGRLRATEAHSRPTTGDTSAAGNEQHALTARTRFAIIAYDLERRPPTANLTLLRQVAELTEAYGGGYCHIDELPSLLQRLATTDRRRHVERQVHCNPVAQHPWPLLVILAAALGLEWAVRKRAALA